MGSKKLAPRRIELVIHNSLPKSLNQKLRRSRWGNHRENNLWDFLIKAEMLKTKAMRGSPIERAKLTIVRHTWSKTMDFDGLVGSLKPVVDALVTAGILKDDSWDVLKSWEVDQVKRPKKSGNMLVITIEEILD